MTVAVEGQEVVWCSNCEDQIKNVSPGFTQPDNGLVLDMSGHYAGFTDYITEPNRVVLCHDCIVLMLKVLPGIAARFEGGHPYRGEPCCEWGWTI